MTVMDHIQGHTYHGRKGAVENAFRYSIDYVLMELDRPAKMPFLFSRNRFNVASLHDSDHGGPPKKGAGVSWVHDVLGAHDLPTADRVELLAQPRFWGHVFNPVSFWLCYDAQNNLRSVITEVTNTFGDRHSYLCHRDDNEPITPLDTLEAQKILHVSPFQPVEGGYEFRFDIRPEKIGIWIDYCQGNGGLIATLVGDRKPLTNGSILTSVWRRPLGSRRVSFLIHWQAIKLWWKKATFRNRPEPPTKEVSR
ncbi:MAG: DUF1365 domain-containing protein [Pseudomonadota bacterium]